MKILKYTGQYLPIHLKPLPGELLSSWITRLSRAHGMLLHTFTAIIFNGKSLWNRDIDNSVDDSILAILCQKTGVSFRRAFKTTLKSFEGKIFECHHSKRTTPWIMSVDVYHRLRLKFGLQFCPKCLSEQEPYFRRKWRLAFVTLCEKHKKLLLDRCPYCMKPVNFHRLNLRDGPISLCFSCRKNLAHTEKFQGDADIQDIAVQKELKKIMHRGWVQITNRPIYSHLYFAVYHQLCRLVVHAFSKNKWLELKHFTGKAQDNDFWSYKYFEDMPIFKRNMIISIVNWMLEAWPNRFIRFCSDNKVYRSLLNKDFEIAPFWYISVINEFLYRPDYHFSDREVLSAIGYLKNSNRRISEKLIGKLLGTYAVFKNKEHIKRIHMQCSNTSSDK